MLHPLEKFSGVYKITCTATGKIYIGGTMGTFRRRWKIHLACLGRGEGASRLQNAWNKYGANAFKFAPLVVCAPKQVLQMEQMCIDLYRPALNMLVSTNKSSCYKMKHSEEVRARAAANARKQWATGAHTAEKLIERSKARAKRFLVRGEWLTVLEMVEKFGIKKVTIQSRLAKGIIGDDLVAQPQAQYRVHCVFGEYMTSGEIAKKFDLSEETVLWRIRHGVVGDDLAKPSRLRKKRTAKQ
jgi:group I intron endonuclease